MKQAYWFYGIVFFGLISASVLVWNNYSIEVQERPDKPIKLPAALSGRCEIEQCHGYDLTCGANVAQMCTMEFQLADTCREYVRCEKQGRSCTRITDPQFERCVSCVKTCSKQQSTDSFDCMTSCMRPQ